jgi:arylsulfatase A-like enzyme/predicted Zn-dependent protease
MKKLIAGIVTLAALGAVVILWPRLRSGVAPPPSIVLITLDTTRADRLGCYGHDQPTSPTLDRLAATGVRFADAEAPTPLTLPSHASLLTGVSPVVHGLRDNGAGVLPKDVPHLAEVLQGAGYATGAFVSAAPLDSRFGLDRGFLEYDDELDLPARDGAGGGAYPYTYAYAYGYQTYPEGMSIRHSERPGHATVTRALAWLSRAPRPFFLWVHLFEPHRPWTPHPDCKAILDDPYDAEIRTADQEVARLWRALEASDELDRTVLVAAADHGEGLGDHGEPAHALLVYRTTQHVPLLLRLPHQELAGTVVEAPVSLLDVPVTLAALAGAELGPLAEGHDLRQVALRGTALTPLLCESLHGARNFGWASIGSWREGTLRLVTGTREELFDLASDPAELRNLAPARPEEVKRLRAARAEHLARLAQAARVAERVQIDQEQFSSLPYHGAGYAGGGQTPVPPGTERRDPRDGLAVAAALDRIKAELAGGSFATARRQAESLCQEDPGNPFLHILLARACKGEGDLPAAQEALRAARALDPGNVEIHAGLLDLRIHALQGLDEDAAASARDSLLADSAVLVEQAPWSGSLWFNRGRILRLAGNLNGAHLALERAASLGTSRARGDLAILLLDLGKPADAVDQLEQAAGAPSLASARQRVLEALLASAASAWADGSPDRALARYALAVRLDGTSVLAHLGQARIHLAAGSLDQALAEGASAVRCDDRDPEARVLLGQVFLAADRPEEAREQLRIALDLAPEHPTARRLLEQMD